MAVYHALENAPRPKSVIYVNETYLADPTVLDVAEFDRSVMNISDEADNVRIYLPLDINRKAILRRMFDLNFRYGEPTEENEMHYFAGMSQIISQLEIYDEYWSSETGMSDGHSEQAALLAADMLQILKSWAGAAISFPYDLIAELEQEYGI